MGRKKIEFEKLLIKSVDDSLKDTFGEVAAQIIYKHLEKYLNSGVIVVEDLVLKKLCSNLGFERPREERISFVDYVTKLKEDR